MKKRRHIAAAGLLCAVGMVALLAVYLRRGEESRPAPTLVGGTGTSTTVTSAPGLPGPPQPMGVDLTSLLANVQSIAARVDAAAWNVDVKATTLDPAVEPAFAYVRDKIGFDAYAGVLRGASGTYAALAGNTPDRALLLARLLSTKGIRTRFALGTLDVDQRQRILQRVFDTGNHRRPAFPLASNTTGRFYDRLLLRAERDYQVIRSALAERRPSKPLPSNAELLAEMNPHVWVQAEVNGQWVDLDPAFRDSTVGQAATGVQQVLSDLPSELHQRVTIRVVAEHVAAGSLRSSTLLETRRNAVDLVDTQIVLIHTKTTVMGGLGSAIVGAIGGGDSNERWLPVLLIHGTPLQGDGLRVSDLTLAAEWLEFEIEWPGGRRELTRRALLDRGGAAWHRVTPHDPSRLRPLVRDAGGPVALRAIHNVWLSGGAHDLADFAAALEELGLLSASEASDPTQPEDSTGRASPSGDEDPGRAVWPFALQNFTWMIWSDHVAVPLINDTPGVRLYADGPRIAVFTQGQHDNGQISITTDLRRDVLRGVASEPALAAAVSDKKLRFGVLQGALEHEALTLTAVATGGDATLVQSTSSAVTSATPDVFGPAPATNLPNDIHPDSAARILESVRTGHMVVALRDTLNAGGAWWQISAATGDVVAVAHEGLNGGYLRPYVPKNPLYVRPTPQQNPFGGQKLFDARTPKEAFAEAYEARRAKQLQKAAAEAQRFNRGLSQPQPQPRGGGSEYGVLITVVTVVAGVAFKILGVLCFILITAGIEELIFGP